MQVGIGIDQKNCRSSLDDGKQSNDELRASFIPSSNRNALGFSLDNESNSDASVSANLRNPPRPYPFNKSTSLGNLSFINVVGLPPCHPRQTSVPSSTTSKNKTSTIHPFHARNASEPQTTPVKVPQLQLPNNVNVGTNINLGGTATMTAVKAEPTWNHCGASNSTDFRLSSPSSIGQNLGTEIWNKNSLVVPARPTDGSHININDNVSNVNVNFYRAVPMNVMSSVPTIECSNNQTAKNVSNVQIMPLSGSIADRNSSSTSSPCRTSITSCRVTVQTEQPPTQLISPSTTETVSSVYLPSRVAQRTFTSTEAQTDDSSLGYGELSNNKDRRRRERRERRHNRRTNPVHSRSVGENGVNNGNPSTLPDILDSHLPPPYTSHPNTLQRNQVMANHQPPPGVRVLPHLGMIPQTVIMPPPQMLGGMIPPQPVAPNMIPHPRPRNALQSSVSNSGLPHVSYPPPNVISGQIPVVQNAAENNSGFRFALPVGQFSRDHFTEESPKSCCGVLTWKPGSLKWLIASVALVAVGCVLVGTALGTMRPAGRDHFTIALLMIGIGIVLVTISGVAWRLASQNATSCRTMLGIGSLESVDVCTRRFVPRLPPTYGRPHHPYAAMMYPEFQYRPPPPTYQASMQEYRLRLLLIDRGNTPQIQAGVQNTVSPPPTYRSHSGSLIRDQTSVRNETAWSEYSCPPSYRSQAQLGTIEDSISVHTRDPSLVASERAIENNVEVVNILREPQEVANLDGVVGLDSKVENSNQYKLILEDCGGSFENDKDDNLVTIVQTDERNPVIVTVSGNSSTDSTSSSNKLPSEIQILAHL
ncbi:uncharacterized protein LOC123317464 [Coccinella septempunctata]|uniref:uncharacterized protein LOC123317464 n=1 Tax=Coccinella septempunctata TaxID=41139 RepID=UPI001D061E6A|nr:uncharacterized protein LOC123317464 [Coccinella septempunctata]